MPLREKEKNGRSEPRPYSQKLKIVKIVKLKIFLYTFAKKEVMMKDENKIVIYQDDNEITRVSVRFSDEDLWLTQEQLAEIYCTTQQNISQHIDNIYKDGELSSMATHKKFLLVRQEGNRQVKRDIAHYNLDMIIALGYRVQSQVA